MPKPGWVTDDILNRCILKNAELLTSMGTSRRILQHLKRPPTERAAVALERITGLPFIAARIRPPDQEDCLWEQRLSATAQQEDGEETQRQERPEVPVMANPVNVGIRIDSRGAERDLPEDLEYIHSELLEEELLDVDEVDPNEVREIIDETRKREEAAVLFEKREHYVVNARRRLINPYLLDEHGERIKVSPKPSREGTVDSRLDTGTRVSSEGSSVQYRCELLNAIRRIEELSGKESSMELVEAAEDDDSMGDGVIELSDNDSLIFAPGETDSETEDPTQRSESGIE
uniref:Uncharacterized protein n=1 Tax=Steinernema glaseri TaxID=37863 RepID=A0A1I7ZTA6_9BILA